MGHLSHSFPVAGFFIGSLAQPTSLAASAIGEPCSRPARPFASLAWRFRWNGFLSNLITSRKPVTRHDDRHTFLRQ